MDTKQNDFKKCCRTCLFRSSSNYCTSRPFSEGGPELIPTSSVDSYVCRDYKPKPEFEKMILNEGR